MQNSKTAINKARSQLNSTTVTASRDKKEMSNTKEGVLIALFSVFALACLGWLIWGIAYIAIYGESGDGSFFRLMMACLGFFAGPAGIAVFAVFISKFIKKIKNAKEKALKYNNEINTAKANISANQSKLQKETERYNAAVALLDNEKKEYTQKLISVSNEYEIAQNQAKTHISAGSALITALNNTYSDILDYRDWQNLDYVIYCLETRRADDMKEALQLTDAEKRTNRIVQAVEDASREICRTLDLSISRLQNDMRICFNVLNEQMASQTKMLMENVNSVKRGVAAQSSYLNELTSSVKLNNALRAKSNVTSEQLANDIEYIRKYELN